MKLTLKYFLAFAFIFMLTFVPKNIFANNDLAPSTTVSQSAHEKTVFQITGGINIEKHSEATFDKSRTITGQAERDTDVLIVLHQRNEQGLLVETGRYSANVGASGIFSQTIDLKLGTNFVTLTATKNNKVSYEFECKIKRKSEEIKNKLQDSIVLPGITAKN